MDNKQHQMKKTSSMSTAYHHYPPPPPYHPTAYNPYPYMPPYNMHQHQLAVQPMMPPIQQHQAPPIPHHHHPTTNPFNVTVIPAEKLTRKRKYCKQEGCRLKQRKGEYCFKHHAMNAIPIVHDGAAPDLTKLVPPTIQEVQQQQLTTHRERKKIQQMNRSEFISSLQHAAVGDESGSCRRVPPPVNTNDQVPIYREAKKQTKPKPKIQPVPRSRSESISSLQHKQSQEQEMEMLQLLHKQQFETLRLQHLLQQCRDDVVEAATTVRSATYDYDQRTSTSTVKGGECIRDIPSSSSDTNKHSLKQLEAELRLLHQFEQYQIPPVYKNVNSLSEQRKSIPSATRDRRDETVRRADYDQGIEECRDPSPVDHPSPVVDLTAEEDTPQAYSSSPHPFLIRCHAQSTIDYLNSWISLHRVNPFPDAEEKARICADTGLSKRQLGDWMARARKKLRKKSNDKKKSPSATVSSISSIPSKVENLLLALKNPNSQPQLVPGVKAAIAAPSRKRKISQSSSSDLSTTRPNKMSLLLQALEEKLE